MRLLLVCVGRAKTGPERVLAERYIERAGVIGRAAGFSDITLRETDESRSARPDDRKKQEAKALLRVLPASCKVIALDETGDVLTSRGFAERLCRARDAGAGSVALVIGGPDGLDPGFLASAWLKLSFGAMTWPHQLVRIMAAEQIYRAITIASGHPYHRN